MAGDGDLDYGFLPPEVFRPNDPWDAQQGWENKTDQGITGPHGSDIEYGWGTTGIVNTEQDTQKNQVQKQQDAEPETLVRYYVPPKVSHPAAREHKDQPAGTELAKQSSALDKISEKEALQELIANPRWQVVRAGEEWRVLRPPGSVGLEPEAHALEPACQGVLVIVEPKRINRAQLYLKELRARGREQTCVCLVEKAPSCRDPVAVATMSNALLACGADEVLMDGWLNYYVGRNTVGGYKASLTGRGMVANPVAGNISYEAGGYGGASVYSASGMVSIS